MSEGAAAALSGDNGGQDFGEQDVGNQGATTEWNSGFDEPTNAYVSAKGWKSPSDVLNSYRNLEKFAGGSKNLVELPGPNADPEAWGNFYSKLGRPETADKYNLNAPEDADADLVDWYRNTAHKIGLSDSQAAEMFNAWNTLSGERIQAMEAETARIQEQDILNLRKEWGQAYDSKVDAGRKAVKALGLDKEALSDLEGKLGTADMLKLFANLGSKMGEDSFVTDDRKGGGFGVTPAAARQQISDLKMDKQFMDQYMSGHPEALNKMKRLMEAAHG